MRIAEPEAKASQQPFRPQPQRGPSTINLICPTSPAAPRAPRTSRPSDMIPAPMPVLRVTYAKCFVPFPRPTLCSAMAAALASFSRATGTPKAFWSMSRRGTVLYRGKLGGSTRAPATVSTGPGRGNADSNSGIWQRPGRAGRDTCLQWHGPWHRGAGWRGRGVGSWRG